MTHNCHYSECDSSNFPNLFQFIISINSVYYINQGVIYITPSLYLSPQCQTDCAAVSDDCFVLYFSSLLHTARCTYFYFSVWVRTVLYTRLYWQTVGCWWKNASYYTIVFCLYFNSLLPVVSSAIGNQWKSACNSLRYHVLGHVLQ